MVIVSLKQHFPARLPEWWMSLVLVSWGAYVVLHPQLFTDSASSVMFAGMAAMATAAAWGLSAVVSGLMRAFALFVNGSYTRTPFIRLAMSLLSAFIWTQVSIGLLKSGVVNTGIVVYPLFVLLDIASAYRASTDMVFAEKVRHDLRMQKRSSGVRSSFYP